jgi:hypothetical protein
VAKVRNDSNIGVNGLGSRETAGYYGSGRRSAPPPRKVLGMIYRVRRHARPIGLFLVFAAVALMISAIAPALFVNASGPDIPVKTEQGPPPPPYNVFGYVLDSLANPQIGVFVTITDNNTGAVWTNVSDDYGFYMVDLRADAVVAGSGGVNWSYNDVIYVNATDGVFEGSNEGIAVDPYLWLDISLTVAIPEFPMVIVPVLGMVAIAAVVSLKRRSGEI